MACLGSPIRNSARGPPSSGACANTRLKMAHCSGSVSWNSSTSAMRYCARSALARASPCSPSSACARPRIRSSKPCRRRSRLSLARRSAASRRRRCTRRMRRCSLPCATCSRSSSQASTACVRGLLMRAVLALCALLVLASICWSPASRSRLRSLSSPGGSPSQPRPAHSASVIQPRVSRSCEKWLACIQPASMAASSCRLVSSPCAANARATADAASASRARSARSATGSGTVGAGSSTSTPTRSRNEDAIAAGDGHSAISVRASSASWHTCLHRSVATSSRRPRSFFNSSTSPGTWPASSAWSASARRQKPWMVCTGARSIASAARRRRVRSVSAVSCASAACTRRAVSTSPALAGSAAAPSARRAARPRRSRMRVRSSCVAASVKVTARICSTGSCRSITRRAYSVARVKVLPVPALASTSCRPDSGRRRPRSRSASVIAGLQ